MNAYSTLRTGRIFAALAGCAALGLAACSEPPEKTYETRTKDQSGGEFIVNDARSEGVAVDLPTTAMTPVPDESGADTAGTQAKDRAQ